MSKKALELALRSMRPSTDEVQLLRALVLTGPEGAEAWSQFCQSQRDLTELFRTDRGELRRLSPLMARNLKTNGADVEKSLWTVLRTASMREGLRAKIYQDVLREVVKQLRLCDAPFAIIRGAELGALSYGDVSARHSHDIDVLVNGVDISVFGKALQSAGYEPEPPLPFEAGRTTVTSFAHATSLPVRLHTALFELDCFSLPTATLLEHVCETNLEGIVAPVLSAEMALLQILGHASYSPTRHTLQWVPDAVRTVKRVHQWPVVVNAIVNARLSVGVHALVTFLNKEIEAVVPADTAQQIETAANRASFVERDLALYGARLGSRRGVSSLFSEPMSVFQRLTIMKWIVAPSAEYLRWARGSEADVGSVKRGVDLVKRLLRYAQRPQTPPVLPGGV